MDASGERRGIGIIAGADDDARVESLCFLMQADEVETIQGEAEALEFGGMGQDLIVGDFLVCLPGFVGG